MPKGSFLKGKDINLSIGTLEGLALYLNGTELSDETYETCESDYVVEKINELLVHTGTMYSHWQGANETALYFYGSSFDEMKLKMEPFLLEYPLCHKCRIERIA